MINQERLSEPIQNATPNEIIIEGMQMVLKGIVLKLLQDEDIRSALQAVNTGTPTSNLLQNTEEAERLKTELETERRRVSELQNDLETQKSENSSLQKDYEVQKNRNLKLEQKVNDISERYAELDRKATPLKKTLELYEQYQGLSEASREYLKDILGDTAERFAMLIGDLSSVNNLFDKCLYCISNRKNVEDFPQMSALFDSVFEAYNSLRPNNQLIRDNETKPGMAYDSSRHNRIGPEKPNGKINEVLLRGYSNRNTGKSIRDTAVSLTEGR